MEIERTTFGTITIDGKTYEHDVIIRLSGKRTGPDLARVGNKYSDEWHVRHFAN